MDALGEVAEAVVLVTPVEGGCAGEDVGSGSPAPSVELVVTPIERSAQPVADFDDGSGARVMLQCRCEGQFGYPSPIPAVLLVLYPAAQTLPGA